MSAEVEHVYNDCVIDLLPVNPFLPSSYSTYNMGYELYEVKLADHVILGEDDIRFFGNAGYALITIPDSNKKLNNIFRDWTIDDPIIMTVTLSDGSYKDIEMEVYEYCTDRMEINQAIIRPKNLEEFSRPCEPTIDLTEVYYYEKRSFNERPEGTYELIYEDFVGEDDVVNYLARAELDGDYNGPYSITKFGRDTMFISVVFRGAQTGRIKGVTRTKMLTWVRQPYCRDVEINYSWGAAYTHSMLTPTHVCYGRTGQKSDVELWTKGYTPRCGDHDLNIFSGQGPMWYPYTECDDYAVYPTHELTGRATLIGNRKMEVFDETGDDGSLLHGAWDLRMLGPQDHEGYICEVHASFWNCTCDWSYCNLTKVGENIFNGSGQYRGNLSSWAKIRATLFDGTLPKFGNPVRDFIRSYRSIDNVDYYASTGSRYVRLQKWMPLYYFYTSADVTAPSSNHPYRLYTKDLTSPFIHPLGLLLANGKIEGIDIEEQLDVDGAGNPKRYDFNDVFRVNSTRTGATSAMAYPFPVDTYFVGTSMLMSWYTYQSYPAGGKSIQWAWQEIWKPVIRDAPETSSLLEEDIQAFDIENLGAATGSPEIGSPGEVEESIASRPYQWDIDTAEGLFLFCDVEYPDYRYDAELGEYALTLEEGDYVLSITAPQRETGGEYDDKKFYIQIGSGPKRAFDIDGNWDPDDDDNQYYDLYTTCTQSPWVTNVTLFGPGYTNKSESAAESDGRVIITYDGFGAEVKTYYQRGLNITLNTSKFQYLPRLKQLIVPSYELETSKDPSFTIDEDNPYEAIEADDTTPVTEHCINLGYLSSDDTVDFKFDFNSKKAIDRIIFQFKFGSEIKGYDANNQPNEWRLYHIPAIEVAHSDVGLIYTTVFTSGDMILATNEDKLEDKEAILDWNALAEDVLDPHQKWRFRFRLKPTDHEISAQNGLSEYYEDSESVVVFNCIYIYDTSFGNGRENIEVFERKYNISYGEHGDFPPHGFSHTNNLLLPATHEFSTVYQRDTIDGVQGMAGTAGEKTTMNKIRGRIMKECHEDEEELPVNTLSKMEAEQKKIYDEIAIKSGASSFTMRSIVPPGFADKLEEVGATFPERWTCTFTNTIVLPLTPVTQYDPYNACGEYFDHDFSNFHWEVRCAGSHFSPFSVGSREVFEYTLYSACDGEALAEAQWAIDVYYQGIGRVLTAPMTWLAGEAAGRETVQTRLNETTYSYPGSVTTY
jgi:hypothetical protein